MSIMHNGEKVLNNLTTVPITQTINASSTETQIPSAKAVNTELDKKANDDEVVKKTDISKTIDSTSTDDTVPSTKAVYNKAVKSLSKIKKTNNFTKSNTGVNTLMEFIIHNDFCDDTSAEYIFGASGFDDLPSTDWGYTIRCYNTGGAINVFAYKYLSNEIVYTRGMTAGGEWTSAWKRVCTTSVADVAETEITTFTDSDVNGKVIYSVKNGICYVTLLGLYSTTAKSNIKVCGLPSATTKPHVPLLSAAKGTGQLGVGFLGADGIFTMHIFIANNGIYTSFSYPVAES